MAEKTEDPKKKTWVDTLGDVGKAIFGGGAAGAAADDLKNRKKRLDDEERKSGANAGELGKSWNDTFNS